MIKILAGTTETTAQLSTSNGWVCKFWCTYKRPDWEMGQSGYTGVITAPDGDVVEVIGFERKIFAVQHLAKLAGVDWKTITIPSV